MAAPPQPGAASAPEAREARDVMAFGHEVGRALSDGRIVGRAEPFAKVFPSSRAVKRAVGAVAWLILEDIALDARVDDAGRLVSETSVRRIAANLGLNKDTVTKHLMRLREHGFVFQEEGREVASGRWESCRYVLDPSACVERFTHTPTAAEPQNPRSDPCPKSSDTVGRPVSEDTGHGDFGQGKEHEELQEQQHAARAGAPADAAGDAAADAAAQPHADGVRRQLLQVGVAGHVADDLLARHPVGRLAQVLEASAAQQTRNAAGWVVTALAGEWDVTDRLTRVRAERSRREHAQTLAAEHHGCPADEAAERERGEGWAAAVSAALDDAQLAEAVALAATTVPGLNRISLPLTRAQLLAWAAAAAARFPDRPLPEALTAALAARLSLRADAAAVDALPRPPPHDSAAAADLSARVAAVLGLPRPSARNRKGAA